MVLGVFGESFQTKSRKLSAPVTLSKILAVSMASFSIYANFFAATKNQTAQDDNSIEIIQISASEYFASRNDAENTASSETIVEPSAEAIETSNTITNVFEFCVEDRLINVELDTQYSLHSEGTNPSNSPNLNDFVLSHPITGKLNLEKLFAENSISLKDIEKYNNPNSRPFRKDNLSTFINTIIRNELNEHAALMTKSYLASLTTLNTVENSSEEKEVSTSSTPHLTLRQQLVLMNTKIVEPSLLHPGCP